MSTDRIHAILDDFTSQIRAEIHRQAIAALGGLETAAPAARSVTRAKTSHSSEGKGVKRDPALIDKLQDQLLSFVKQHPGLRVEQINKQLGTTTRELALPIRKLIAAKSIRTNGEKRATTYSAGGSAKKTVANKTVKRRSTTKRSSKSKRNKPAAKPAVAAATTA